MGGVVEWEKSPGRLKKASVLRCPSPFPLLLPHLRLPPLELSSRCNLVNYLLICSPSLFSLSFSRAEGTPAHCIPLSRLTPGTRLCSNVCWWKLSEITTQRIPRATQKIPHVLVDTGLATLTRGLMHSARLRSRGSKRTGSKRKEGTIQEWLR